jgi:3-phenylpropionate/trans-cinnamate dioxygenase ferredoxin reductase component
MSESDRVVIVGAGHAAGECATALRQEGFTGPIRVIGAERHLPYQRPPLSKAYLAGQMGVEALTLRQRAAYERGSIEMLLNTEVTRIDRAQRRVETADGARHRYAKLVLATGGRARRLDSSLTARARDCGNFHTLRTIDDVDRIRPQFSPGFRLTIIGGGYIGLEVAAVAIKHGLVVTVIEALPRVLARVTAPEISAFYERVHGEAGVDVRTNSTIESFELDESGDAIAAVATSRGRIAADLVIVGIGLQPNVELASAAGLKTEDGIWVDEFTRTSDPDIHAIGDCTNQPNAALGRRLRLESVPNAVEQGRAAAAVIAGKPRPYQPVPWFWSDQYDLKLQMVGISRDYDRLVIRGSTAERHFIGLYLRGGRIIAADAVSRPAEFMVAKRLVAAQTPVDPARLADSTVALKSLIAS